MRQERRYQTLSRKWKDLSLIHILRGSLQLLAMRRFFAVNRDIFLRTLCLIGVTTFFTSTGARQGDVILAVNTLLMQLFTLFSYIMDGFAYAGEALTGRYVGAVSYTHLDISQCYLLSKNDISPVLYQENRYRFRYCLHS